ncbi:hypothetical protein IJJ97_07145 [bacterium]|nr:hypothetical protein [bacterium]
MNSILSALLKPITTYDNKSSLNLNLTDKKPTEENNDKSKNVADNYIFSDEAQEEMIEINGTDGNDKIKASVKNGKIIIDVNGQKQEYTSEEAQKGFKINSGDGNDNIDISAVLGNLLIDSGEGDNKINLGKGNNILKTGDGNNNIKAKNAQENIINTGNGNNSIDVKADKNTITTGSGNDSINVDGKDNIINSGAGNDNINTHGHKNNVNAGEGDDIINSNGGRDKIHAGDGNDTITSEVGNAVIYGDDGEDTIKSKGSNNSIYGGNDNDNITVFDGNNYIESGKGDDNITAGDGNNVIYGLDGNDNIKAGNGDNYIDGGKDNDNITVGTGKNIVFGGLGEDNINAQKSSGKVFDDNEGTINASNKMEVNTHDKNSVANLGKSVSIDGTDDFQMRIESDLEALKMLKTGQKWLSEMDNSGHTVTIQNTDDKNGYAEAHGTGYSTFIKNNGERGAGADTTIAYNPSFKGPANGVPLNVVFHEGVHAYNNATGTKQPGEQIREDGTSVNKREQQCVGLPIENGLVVTHPDGTKSADNPKELTENAIRAELGLEQRTRY